MANRRLTTLLESPIISDDMVAMQSNKILVGTMVESLIIKFDQNMYEEFVSSDSVSPKSLWKYHNILTNVASHEA